MTAAKSIFIVMNPRKIAVILFLAAAVLTAWMMLIPSPPQMISRFRFFDKIGHFSSFLVMSFLITYAMGRKKSCRKRNILICALILAVYGAALEYLQQFSGRSMELMDLFADLTGIAAGSLTALFFCD